MPEYPEFYPCRRLDEDLGVDIACAQHVALNAHVPCWTSRPHVSNLFCRLISIILKCIAANYIHILFHTVCGSIGKAI